MGFRTAPYAKIKYTVQRFSFMLPNVHFSGCHRSFVITSGVMSKWTLFKGSWGCDIAPISHDSTASVWYPDPWSSGFDVAAVLSLHTHTPCCWKEFVCLPPGGFSSVYTLPTHPKLWHVWDITASGRFRKNTRLSVFNLSMKVLSTT